MNRRVPGDPVAVRPQDLDGLVGQRRVFEPSLRKTLGDAAVERKIGGRRVRTRVESLVVDDLDRAGRGQLVPAACPRSCASVYQVTSSPRPSSPAPASRTSVVTRVKLRVTSASSRSSR